MRIFRAILKDNGLLDPSMFIIENTFVTDEPLSFYRDSAGNYTIYGFKFNSEDLLDNKKTELYFGRGSDRDCARWAKLSGNSPHNDVSVFTYEANGDGLFSPADGYLNYESIHIILND